MIVKRPLFAVLFSFVYMVTICGLTGKTIGMTIGYKATAYKVHAILYSFLQDSFIILYCM